jgi:hypothetical protein
MGKNEHVNQTINKDLRQFQTEVTDIAKKGKYDGLIVISFSINTEGNMSSQIAGFVPAAMTSIQLTYWKSLFTQCINVFKDKIDSIDVKAKECFVSALKKGKEKLN